MRFTEIGQQLRAYRMESGMRAEEIAARLGVSRAALYRYEKGEVIKLDTVKRLAELLNISPLSLLGIGVEYYGRSIGYLERLRQVEETADQMLLAFSPFCYLITSDAFDAVLSEALEETSEQAGPDRGPARTAAEQVLGILAARKRMFQQRKPTVSAILSLPAVQRFIELGVGGSLALPERLRRKCQDVAVSEASRMAEYMEAAPMGLQFVVAPSPEPAAAFKILRARDRATLALNPFRADSSPTAQTGVAMITSADEAVTSHQRVAETLWRHALKGSAGANALREILQRHAS